MAAHNNQPLSRLRPLLPEKWWSASGAAAGKSYFNGSYSAELEDGIWLAKYNETTRLPNDKVTFETKEAAMQECADHRVFCILLAESRQKKVA